MAAITYTNKNKDATAGTDPTLWKDSDANEVKASVNDLYDFISFGLFAALSAPTLTTIADANVFYPIEGTFSNDPATGFEGTADPAIKYVGENTIYFEIDAHATLSAAVNGTTVQCGIKKNGTLQTASVVSAFCKTSAELYNISGTMVVSLAKNDSIQLVVATDNGQNVTFQNITATIRPFKK